MTYTHEPHKNDDLNSGWLSEEGTYHVCVTEAEPKPNGNGFKLVLRVCNTDERGNKLNHFVNYPSAHHKDGGRFARKILANLLYAFRFIESKADPCSFDPEDFIGRDAIICVEPQENDDRYVEIGKFSQAIYRTDDRRFDGIVLGELIEPDTAEAIADKETMDSFEESESDSSEYDDDIDF